MVSELSQHAIDYLKLQATELEDKLKDWIEKDVRIIIYQTPEESLTNPNECFDEYVGAVYIDSIELVRFTHECALDLIDLITTWTVRHLIIGCGSNNQKLELPEPAQA